MGTDSYFNNTIWKLKPVASALSIGPTQGSKDWWSNRNSDVASRWALFDDTIIF